MEAQPRFLLEAEHVLPCGYAPRTLLQSIHGQDCERIFVGCKDGSLAVAERSGEGFRLDRLVDSPLQGGIRPRAVRALRELDEDRLFVGRSDGAVELVTWRAAQAGDPEAYQPLLEPRSDPEDAVRYLRQIGDRWLISWRSGTWLFTLDSRQQTLHGEQPLLGMRPDSEGPLRGVRVAVPYMERSERWLLATSRGELWIWERPEGGTSEQAVLAGALWPPGETPGFVDDFAVIRQDPLEPVHDDLAVIQQDSTEPVQTIFLSTDLGVYAIDLGVYKPQTPIRLSLPGLGAVCMALSAVSMKSAAATPDSYDFLWAADAQGDSHLFWRKRGFKPPPFRPSGIVNVGSQVMLANSWRRGSSIVFAQARRNDAIAFSVYTVVTPEDAPSRPESRQQKLLRYRHLLLHGNLEDLQAETKAAANWPAYAVLSDFFEMLATRDDDSLRALQEFLSNPSGGTARLILKSLTRDEHFKQEVEAAVRLWVLTLLGIVNRMKGAGETPYLGIVRWLRDLEYQAHGDVDLEQALAPAVRKAIRFARKWGLFGKANAQRGHLVKPLEILRSQLSGPDDRAGHRWHSAIGHQSEAIDLLTYESLLFHRSFDVLHEDARGQMRGRSAWDLAVLEEASRQIVAISWMWGGVELYEVQRSRTREIELDLHLALVPDPARPYSILGDRFSAGDRREPSETWQEKHGYSRAVLLGKVSKHSFLLTAPTVEDRSHAERFHLWQILTDQGRLTVKACDTDEHANLIEGESVYRLLEIEPGRILAGLRGTGGRPRLALLAIEVDPSGGLTLTRRDFDLRSSGAGSETTLRNRIWSLTRAIPRSLRSRDEPTNEHQVAVGCESGEIFIFPLARGQRPQDMSFEVPVDRVAQMSSPVVSLAYLSGYEGGEKGQTDRIFAGGEDGSIVAWQKLHADQKGFASLWSTVEQGPVAAIHPLPYGSPGSDQEPLVLVVTRTGRCAVFDDRSKLMAPSQCKEAWQPQRPRFPGKRLRRSQLGGTAFASKLLCRLPSAVEEGEPVWNEETGRYAVLLTASEQGKIRLVSLHYPQSRQRRRQYDRTVDLWWRITYQNDQHDLLRLVDAAYQAVPLLPLLLVRWILEPEAGQRPEATREPPLLDKSLAWKMPRYLRPLLDLREAWETYNVKAAADALEELLLQAWRHEDLALFQQLCAVVLKRANFAICKAADQPSGEDEKLCDLYLGIFEVLERSIQRWLGDSEREARARIVMAKNLVDGDTFLRVLRRADQEKTEGEPFHRILAKRIQGVRQLVFKHDSLLSLETFRALNLSLMRLCRRLIGTPGQEGSRDQVSWAVFANYFEALTYAAARTFRSRLEMNDSLAHEYCRTFALAVCACPSAAIRIANRMTETQLISDPDSDQDLSRRVIRQFDVLAQIGIPVPDYAVRLFDMASCPPSLQEKELNPVKPVLKSLGFKGVDRPDDCGVGEVGAENAEDLYCLCRLYRVVDWFIELAGRLSTDAKGIDLTAGNLHQLRGWLQGSEKDLLGRLYAHSVRFWNRALDSLGELALPAASQDTIRPEIILRSRGLATWAGRQLAELHRSYRDLEIFQPEYPIFREVLARLERAAKDFPFSAAVQKNLVVSVFGHHLLEDLDEHVFELEELAQNLDPLLVWEFRDRGRVPTSIGPRAPGRPGDGPVAQRFAEYLLHRASHAESIPKNLRALYGILESPPGRGKYPLGQLFKPFEAVGWKWQEGLSRPIDLEARAFQFLSLALAELESNNQKHSGLAPDERQKHPPRISCRPGNSLRLDLRFWFQWDATNVDRLTQLQKKGLQEPLQPREDSAVASTGAGLYLANLAASVVSWQLQLCQDTITREDALGICRFELFPEVGTETLVEL